MSKQVPGSQKETVVVASRLIKEFGVFQGTSARQVPVKHSLYAFDTRLSVGFSKS